MATALIVPFLLAAAPASTTAGSTAGSTAGTTVTVLAPVRLPERELSVVAAVDPAPTRTLARTAASVTVDGEPVSASLAPLLVRETAVALVADTSGEGPLARLSDTRAGAAALLARLPVDATYGLVTDSDPPKVAAAAAAGRSQVQRAIGQLRTGGGRATSAALTLALGQLPPWPLAQPVIVLVTSAPDAGGETASALSARLRAAHVVLAVVHTRSEPAYWEAVSAASGGFTVSVGPPGAISAFGVAADALRGRYVVTAGDVPAVARQAELSLDLGGHRAGGSVALSARVSQPPAPAPGWWSRTRDRWPWLVPAVAGSAVLGLLIAFSASLFRRR